MKHSVENKSKIMVVIRSIIIRSYFWHLIERIDSFSYDTIKRSFISRSFRAIIMPERQKNVDIFFSSMIFKKMLRIIEHSFLYLTAKKIWKSRYYVIYLFLIAMIIRSGALLYLHYSFNQTGYFLDDTTYDRLGWSKAQDWRGGESTDLEEITGTIGTGYYYVVSSIYYSLGHNILIAKLFNALIGSLFCVMIFMTAKSIFGELEGKIASVIVLLSPSMIFWSTQLLKDSIMILLIGITGYLMIENTKKTKPIYFLIITLLLTMMIFIRDYISVILAISFISSLAVKYKHKIISIGILITTFLVVMGLIFQISGYGFLGTEKFSKLDFDYINKVRASMATGGSAYQTDIDISTPTSAMEYMPIGIIYLFFAPFPWTIDQANKMVAFFDVMIFYLLTPFLVYGILNLKKEHLKKSFPLVMYIILLTLLYSLIQGNVGTVVRHRTQITSFLIIFTAAGIVQLSKRLRGLNENKSKKEAD